MNRGFITISKNMCRTQVCNIKSGGCQRLLFENIDVKVKLGSSRIRVFKDTLKKLLYRSSKLPKIDFVAIFEYLEEIIPESTCTF